MPNKEKSVPHYEHNVGFSLRRFNQPPPITRETQPVRKYNDKAKKISKPVKKPKRKTVKYVKHRVGDFSHHNHRVGI